MSIVFDIPEAGSLVGWAATNADLIDMALERHGMKGRAEWYHAQPAGGAAIDLPNFVTIHVNADGYVSVHDPDGDYMFSGRSPYVDGALALAVLLPTSRDIWLKLRQTGEFVTVREPVTW